MILNGKMKAVILTGYGPPSMLEFREVKKPSPKEKEVLVRIHASTVTLGDCEIRNLTLPAWTRLPVRLYFGYRKPKHFIPGMEVSGIVEAVGRRVTTFKPGDEVFGSTGMGMGGNAEYKACGTTLAIKPPALSFADAATIPVGGINALHFLRKANIQPGQSVLINGAGGSIGTYGVQLAKFFGAKVTAVDHTSKLDMLKNIGADDVIDYTKENFFDSRLKYDVIFDIVYSTPFSKCIEALNPEGVYLMANPGPRRMLRSIKIPGVSKKRIVFQFAAETPADLSYLANLIVAGKVKPVIGTTYPLHKLAEAHEHVEQGRKIGCFVVDHIS
jgi:NADPH:quinone reductase-like Zn-dependent oxidoreductase